MGNQDALPDAILELVFLCLDSPLWLHRAASTCKRWRRIIAGDAFRALHGRRPSFVAGSYYDHGISVRPRFEPSPSAAAIEARHFSLDFLPGNATTHWRVKDSRESLLLLYRKDHTIGRWDLIVCEPLTRRLELISHPKPSICYWNSIAVLLDGDDDDDDDSNKGGGGSSVISMSSFRVLLCLHDEVGCIHACMFTSGSSSWRETSINKPPKLYAFGFATGRRYWHDRKKTVVALDQSALKFSSFVLPDDREWGRLIEKVALTIGHDGEARTVVDGKRNVLKIFATQKGGGDEEWALEKTIQVTAAILGLPQLQWYYLTWQPHEHAGMVGIRVPGADAMRFYLDMETMKVERFAEAGRQAAAMGNQDALPDAILELVFLGLNAPLCLHRAASTCKRWRRIIAGDAFHDLYGKRPSVVAGSYHNQGGGYSRPRFEPSPSAADARHFSLDFLPGEGTEYWGWRIKDRRESLLLIYREDWKAQHRDLVVCEPLTRRQKVIPPPNPSVNYWDDEVVLLDGGGGSGGGIGMTSFRVFLYSYEGGCIHAWMFTSGSSSWCKKSICKPPRLFVIGFAAGRHDVGDDNAVVQGRRSFPSLQRSLSYRPVAPTSPFIALRDRGPQP
ncbi:hypothetical protein HU200_014390 [Digitaria exilis]|uniref:F-box domain-containing protein n=1 Tax=Digitaria exilis TaxID=1010633 RepID=A0A835KMX8_9POAL|nr:hypothetical protein HU200_014390 [Digitaria exilis]